VRVLALLLVGAFPALADAEEALPQPLAIEDVLAIARSSRAEILAARARARAAAQRPAIVSALDEPTIELAVDHLPFSGMGADWSVTVEQAFPLSRIRGNRARSARAAARRELAEVDAVTLDVELDAARSFWMLGEARASAVIVDRQHAVAAELVSAATARYAANLGAQADVLRAEIEVTRLDAERRATAAQVRAAEVMLNTSLGRGADLPIPELDVAIRDTAPPSTDGVVAGAHRRPELRGGSAEVERAEAEVRVMRSMYAPMAMVRTGPASTMAEGRGWMVMVGISVPLWRGTLRAGVDEATAMVDMATADLEAMRRMVEGEARSARELVIARLERYRALRDEVVPRAEQAIAPMLAAYSAGQVPLVSVVEAAQALWTAQRELVMAHAELGVAWARLRRASGEEIIP
jgi:outer membrane protein TolC